MKKTMRARVTLDAACAVDLSLAYTPAGFASGGSGGGGGAAGSGDGGGGAAVGGGSGATSSLPVAALHR